MSPDISNGEIQAIVDHALGLLELRILYIDGEPPEIAPIAPFVIAYQVAEVQSKSTDRRWTSRSTEELIISVHQSGAYLKEIARLIRTYHQDQVGENDWIIAAISSDAKSLLETFAALPLDARGESPYGNPPHGGHAQRNSKVR